MTENSLASAVRKVHPAPPLQFTVIVLVPAVPVPHTHNWVLNPEFWKDPETAAQLFPPDVVIDVTVADEPEQTPPSHHIVPTIIGRPEYPDKAKVSGVPFASVPL